MAVATEQGPHVDVGQPSRRRRTGLLWLTVGVVAAAAAGAGYWFVNRDVATGTTSVSSSPAATAEVTRQTLSATESWDGTLGHGEPFTVTTVGQGTITRVATRDSAIARGSELYRLNEQPVVALLGAIPMYRDLRAGDTGIDVEQLETNLAELGYDGFTVDDEYTWNTADAVEEWQEDVGASETGTVAAADVVFIPAGGRTDSVHADAGSTVSPGSAVLDVTGSDQVVSLEVDVVDRDLVAVGTGVTVGLPGGAEVPGIVTAADIIEAEPEGSGGGGPGGDDDDAGADDAVTQVEVTLSEPVEDALLGAPVDVVVNVDERADVLVVPVNALVALAEGGYGLEVVADDGSTSIVPIEAGLFADGTVEVSGEGIDEGTVVGVAGR
jgi:peptidoglycan hydrolase-like protein with peptidoglycan-binding domain